MSHKNVSLFAIISLLILISACGPIFVPAAPPTAIPTLAATPTASPQSTATAAPTPINATDVVGRKLTLAGYPQRIISLAPSNTEILFALDLSSKIVAVDEFSDYPAEAKSLPRIGGSNGKYNFEQIVALKPDLIIAAEINPPEALKKLEDLKLAVFVASESKTTVDNILTDIILVGQVTGKNDKAKTVTDAMKQKLDALKAKIATAKTKPRVYWELDATDPTKPFTVGPGNFVNDIITLAGGTNAFASATKSYPQVSAEQIIAAKPEIIIMSDAAYGVTVDSLMKRKGWQVIAAVKNKNVHPIDDSLVSRPGPRIADGLEAAAKLIHPELFK